MKELLVDIETYASADLSRCGVYRYAESPDFEILLFGYSMDGGPVRVVDLASGETLPPEILDALIDDRVTKWAHNALFERTCLSRYLAQRGITTGYLKPDSWRCTMVWSAYMGLPLSLSGAASVTGVEKQKLAEGKDLIRYFCQPCAPTKANGGRTRNRPSDAPDKWERFKAYNIRDVEAEMAIAEKFAKFPVPEEEWRNYILDQEINDRGIRLDMELVRQAIRCDAGSRAELTRLMRELTDLENPNSVSQMKTWLADQGLETDTLGKAAVRDMLKTAPDKLSRVLALRQDLAKSSVRKYAAMEAAVCQDGRARGLIQFYGASRTGRFSGRLIQIQNLPANNLKDLKPARGLVRSGQFEMVEALYDSVPGVLSELIRTAFIPKDGCKFVVADFSSIERVVLAWLAGEQWVLEAYEQKKDLYIATASQMFRVPAEQMDKKHPLRQKGKVADLACIAEGQLVLTDQGLVPIEEVTNLHKLWDGESWVNHDGVICKGEREVIAYEGLRATPDHLVWVRGEERPIPFGVAFTQGAKLVRTGQGGHQGTGDGAIARVYDIQNAGQHHRFTVSGKLVHNCGYGGSVGALRAMGALEMGLTEEELLPLVKAWRSANPNIVRLWREVDKAAKEVVSEHTSIRTHGILFECKSGMLFIQLPSGRKLSYVRPRIELNRFGNESVTYEGVGPTKKWERIESYGQKFVENLAQSISRDILCNAMRTLDAAGLPIVMTVHDEIVIEAHPDVKAQDVCRMMCELPPWAKGLPMRVEGFDCEYYRKE